MPRCAGRSGSSSTRGRFERPCSSVRRADLQLSGGNWCAQFLTDASGSGNNWAHGHECYGPRYRDELMERIRRPVEFCDSLQVPVPYKKPRKRALSSPLRSSVSRPIKLPTSNQSFLLLHSMGGGTGSGLGTYLLELLADNFPDVYRFASVRDWLSASNIAYWQRQWPY